MRLLIVSILALQLAACGHAKKGAEITERINESNYDDLINRYTKHDTQYDGFYNRFELYATFLNSNTQAAILQKRSDVLEWDQKQAQSEREKMFQENSTLTKFALSLFTPSVRLNDLHKGTSIWKIYLEAGGQRYEGKAMKRNGKLEDIRAIYPYHNRWSTAYDVSFNVPLSVVEKGPITFVLTSSQGTSTLKFE